MKVRAVWLEPGLLSQRGSVQMVLPKVVSEVMCDRLSKHWVTRAPIPPTSGKISGRKDSVSPECSVSLGK